MMKVGTKGEVVREFILKAVEAHPTDIARVTAEHFGITRQAVNRHLRRLVDEGALACTGQTKSKRYKLKPLSEWLREYPLDGKTTEDRVWTQDIKPLLGTMPDNVMQIWQYGFTEMFNNALDHSEGDIVLVKLEKTATAVEIIIADDGVGIFRKIKAALGLADERHAVLELAKGKMTTAPEAHSGEGIFFTSKAFDKFDILSGEVFFSHDRQRNEGWLLEQEIPKTGTAVFMKLNSHTARDLRKLHAQYQDDDDFAFAKTVVPVTLARMGDDLLMSRSQAKRVLVRVEKFRSVIFDFAGVDRIGQAFADEIFRVFANSHPSLHISDVNAKPEVAAMISRARNVVL